MRTKRSKRIGVGTTWFLRHHDGDRKGGREFGVLLCLTMPRRRITAQLCCGPFVCANDLGGSAVCVGSVPAENCLNLLVSLGCGSGTQNSHWKESRFTTELMTGYAGAINTLSKMTIQGLADLGYSVNTLAADPYTVPSSLMALLRAEGDVSTADGIESLTALGAPLLPRFTLERDGRVRPIVR